MRFRSGDIVTLTGTGRCACGRSSPRFRVIGRSDDVVAVRGVNVFPSAVAAVLNGVAEFSGAYRIVLEGPGPYQYLPLEAEIAAGAEATAALAAGIGAALRRGLGVRAEVSLLPARSLPRTAGKTKHVIRKEVP